MPGFPPQFVEVETLQGSRNQADSQSLLVASANPIPHQETPQPAFRHGNSPKAAARSSAGGDMPAKVVASGAISH
jgi:hypothetical protein